MTTQVLVLGGGGFIGRNLCRALQREGHDIVVYGRCASPSETDDRTRVTWIAGDFSDHDRVAAVAADCSLIYHLIGSTSPVQSNADPIGDLNATVVDTLTFLQRLRLPSEKRLVFVSSGGTVYGVPRSLPVGEDHPTDPISAYGINKLTVEKYLHLNRHLHGLDHRVLRLANPFGEHQVSRRQQGVVAAFMRAALRGEPLVIWGDGNTVRDYIHIDDVVDALLRAGRVEGIGERVINVGSGVGRSVREIADAVEAIAGHPLPREFRPARASDVPAVVLDITRAAAVLGWRPRVPWEEALRRSWDWHRHHQAGD